MPTDPPKKAIGMNTADSTSAMPMMAPVISLIDFSVASTRRQALFRHDALDVLDNDDGVIDEQADCQTPWRTWSAC